MIKIGTAFGYDILIDTDDGRSAKLAVEHFQYLRDKAFKENDIEIKLKSLDD